MVRIVTRTIATVVMAVAAFAFGGAPAGAAHQPIGPNQHFAGRVNGTRTSAVIKTVCAGPIWAGRTGPIAGGQTLSVVRKRRGHGSTGLFTQVYAWFVPQSATTTSPGQLKFTSYNAPQAIPTSIAVPCDGTGQVEFSSCPYLAPCAYGWVPDYVTVQFVNIAL
ncbi:MAG: hypothetical protein ACXVJW_08745 [Acidimicrobiia bacterium]